MFHEYYGLQRDPFSLSPDLDFLFLSSVHEEAIAHLVYGLEQKEELITMIGDIGTGKTLALHRLLDQVSRSVVPVSINVTTIGFEELLQLTLLNLAGRSDRDRPVATLIYDLEQELIRIRKQGKSVLLVIDEAQNLSIEDLESARLLLNLAQPGGQALQIVLAGQMGLQAKLDSPRMRQLRQRIKVSYTLGTLNRGEMEEYVQHRLVKAGREKPLFERAALDRIFEASGGVPRVVNYLASKAMLAGYVDQKGMISRRHVDEAVAESDDLVHDEAEPAVVPEPAPEVRTATGPDVIDEKLREVEPALRPEPAPVPVPEPAAIRREPVPTGGERRGRRRGGVIFAILIVFVLAAAATYSLWWPLVWSDAKTAPSTAGAHGANPVAERGKVREQEVTDTAATSGPSEQEAGIPSEEAVEDQAPIDPDEPRLDANTDSAVSESVAATAEDTAEVAIDSFVVHVASFQSPERAEHFSESLAEDGWNSYCRKSPVSYGRIWYRVYLGPIGGREATDQAVASLRADGTITYSQVTHR